MEKIHIHTDLWDSNAALRTGMQTVKTKLQALEAERPGSELWQQRHFAVAGVGAGVCGDAALCTSPGFRTEPETSASLPPALIKFAQEAIKNIAIRR